MTTSKTLNLVDVQPGVRLRTKTGQLVEVFENPKDGIWLLCRIIDATATAADGDPSDGPIEPVFAQDIEGFA